MDLAYVACGRVDAYWEWGLSPWDLAAGSLLVQEAGGNVSTFSGAAWELQASHIVATNHLLLPELTELYHQNSTA